MILMKQNAHKNNSNNEFVNEKEKKENQGLNTSSTMNHWKRVQMTWKRL